MQFTRPETELVIQCLLAPNRPEAKERVQALLTQQIDWPFVLELTERNRVGSLVYYGLREVQSELASIPQDVLQPLETHFHSNLRRNLLLMGELLKLAEGFCAHDIPVIAFKGPVLAQAVYGNLALREAGDIDVLVHRHHVERAGALLVEQGYQYQEASTHNPIGDYHAHFVRQPYNIVIELHWSLTRKDFKGLTSEDFFWQHAQIAQIQNHRVCTPSIEDFLLFACAHGFKHEWHYLLWVYDLVEVVHKTPNLDWEYVLATCKTLYGQKILLFGLYLADHIFGLELPDTVARQVRQPESFDKLVAQIEANLFSVDSATPAVDQILMQYLLRERWIDRFNYLWSKTSPNRNEQNLLPLPSRLSFLYYVVRPVRLFVEHGVPWLKARLRQR